MKGTRGSRMQTLTFPWSQQLTATVVCCSELVSLEVSLNSTHECCYKCLGFFFLLRWGRRSPRNNENLGVEGLNEKISRVHERPLANKSCNNITFLRQFIETFFIHQSVYK